MILKPSVVPIGVKVVPIGNESSNSLEILRAYCFGVSPSLNTRVGASSSNTGAANLSG